MTSLIEKIKQSRRFRVECEGVVFVGSLLTREKFFLMGRDGFSDAELARRMVDGWEGVTEAHLVEGGLDELIPFDKELFDEIIGDKQSWWRAIADFCIAKYNETNDKKEAAEKNSRSGSKAKA